MIRRFSILFFCVLATSLGLAQAPGQSGSAAPVEILPWGDTEITEVDGHWVCARLGRPDHRVQSWSARRLSARRRARQRALRDLHLHLDRLVDPSMTPLQIQRMHERLPEVLVERGVRALVNGDAVVVVAVPVQAFD